MQATNFALTHADRLDRYAEVIVKVGLNVGAGQEVIVNAPVDALPLVRRIAVHAYKAGANLLTPFLHDDQITVARFEHGADASFDATTGWMTAGLVQALNTNATRLRITGEDPNLLAGQDPAKLARANKAAAIASKPVIDLITASAVNWSVVAAATPAWARQVFPDLPAEQALAKLWDAIFATTRVDTDDPIAAWAAHNARLQTRQTMLTARNYHALHFQGPGTDLTVGLADGHAWKGGLTKAKNGIAGNPNLPTEEVFTTPHRLRTDGWVTSTKPLSYNGTLITGLRMRFEAGAVTEVQAQTGLPVVERLLGMDEGARRLGEVALVPNSSPVSQSGLLFKNTLFDENAASHIAVGRCYEKCFVTDDVANPDELLRRGGNTSMIHVDWMIGSGEIAVAGVTAGGVSEPLMRDGEWVTPA